MTNDKSFSILPTDDDVQYSVVDFSPDIITVHNINDLISRVAAYFDYCNRRFVSPTFSGLALSVGLSRQKLKNFLNDNPEHPFTPLLEKAKLYIIEYAERQLFHPKASGGVAFWLKNNDDWTDKADITFSKTKTMADIIVELGSSSSSPLEYDNSPSPSHPPPPQPLSPSI